VRIIKNNRECKVLPREEKHNKMTKKLSVVQFRSVKCEQSGTLDKSKRISF
jgi:hypothetical protein